MHLGHTLVNYFRKFLWENEKVAYFFIGFSISHKKFPKMDD